MSNLTLYEQVVYCKEQEKIRYDMYELISTVVPFEDAVKITIMVMDRFLLENKHDK